MWSRGRFFSLVALLLFSLPLQLAAQTTSKVDLVVGPTGGGLYDNYFIGVKGGLETNYRVAPYIYGEFDPYNSHVALGSGYAYSMQGGAVGWFTNSVGLNGNVERSAYNNTIYKAGYFAKGGLAAQLANPWGKTRLFFNYVQQFNNGIDRTGTETAQLRGGEFIYDGDMGCAKHFCNRLRAGFQAGHVRTQGNPECDGTYHEHEVTCKRGSAWSGGAEVGWFFQFGGRQ